MRPAALATLLTVSFAIQRLELDLNVDYAAERIDGTARLTVKNVSSEPASGVPLLLGRLMRFRDLTQEVVVFDDDAKRQVAFATAPLPKPLAPGASATISVAYGGPIVGYTETGSLYIKDRVAEEFTIIREDAYAFPTTGVPSMKALKSAPRGDFTFDLRVTVPAGFVVGAGGVLLDKRDHDGRATYHFASDVPLPFLNITVAKYKTLDANGVRIDYFPADQSGAAMVMDRAQKALALYESWLGPLRRAPRFTILEIPDDFGAQAHPVAGIMLEAGVFHDVDRLGSLYHEVGHFWNGADDEVPSPRWNEGLSTWFQESVREVIDQKPSPWLAPRMLKKVTADERLKRVPLRDYGKERMTDASYSVGYLYFRVLEKKIGRPAMLAVLREYFQGTQPKTLRAFVALLETRHPETRAINADWIETTGWTAKAAQAPTVDALLASY